MVECLSCVGALLPHDLAPVGAEMIDDGLDGLICIAKIFFVKFFNVLLLDAVNDSLHANGGDGLLQVKLLLEPLCLGLESEEVELTRGVINFWIDQGRLAETRGAFYYRFCYDFVVRIVQDECKGSMESAPCGCFDWRDHLGHLLCHFFHGRHGWLSDDYVKRLCHHD
jgi:hypothetical protein